MGGVNGTKQESIIFRYIGQIWGVSTFIPQSQIFVAIINLLIVQNWRSGFHSYSSLYLPTFTRTKWSCHQNSGLLRILYINIHRDKDSALLPWPGQNTTPPWLGPWVSFVMTGTEWIVILYHNPDSVALYHDSDQPSANLPWPGRSFPLHDQDWVVL